MERESTSIKFIRSDKICIGTNPHFRFCRRKIIIINFKIFLCLKQLLFQLWWILIKWWPWAKAIISLNIVYRSVIISLIISKAYIYGNNLNERLPICIKRRFGKMWACGQGFFLRYFSAIFRLLLSLFNFSLLFFHACFVLAVYSIELIMSPIIKNVSD